MVDPLADVLRNQIRGVAGALLVVGLPVLYTSEMWRLGWRLPILYLLAYALVGLSAILLVTRRIGFRAEAEDETVDSTLRIASSFAELVLQSFVAAYVVLLAFGIVDLGDSLDTVVRIGLINVVPLGLGASISNRLLAESDEEIQEATFPQNVPTFAFGAVFFAFTVAPTREIELIAVHAGWWRLAGIVFLSVLVIQLVLYELEFRGHSSRIASRTAPAQLGTTFVVYAVSIVVSVALLAAFGHFAGTRPTEWVQQTIVLGFVASAGASAGEVVL